MVGIFDFSSLSFLTTQWDIKLTSLSHKSLIVHSIFQTYGVNSQFSCIIRFGVKHRNRLHYLLSTWQPPWSLQCLVYSPCWLRNLQKNYENFSYITTAHSHDHVGLHLRMVLFYFLKTGVVLHMFGRKQLQAGNSWVCVCICIWLLLTRGSGRLWCWNSE